MEDFEEQLSLLFFMLETNTNPGLYQFHFSFRFLSILNFNSISISILFLNRFDFDLRPLVSLQKKFLPPFERCEDAVVFFVSCWKNQEDDDDEQMDTEVIKKGEDEDEELIRMKNQQMFMKNLTFFKEMIKPKLNDPLTNSWASSIVKSLEKVVKENGIMIETKELDQDFKMDESINSIPMSSLYFCQIECCFEIIVNQFSTKLVSFLFCFSFDHKANKK